MLLLRKLQCSLKKKLKPVGLAGLSTVCPLPVHSLISHLKLHEVTVGPQTNQAFPRLCACHFCLILSGLLINSCVSFKSELKAPFLWEDIPIA